MKVPPHDGEGRRCKVPAIVPACSEEIDLSAGGRRPPRPAVAARKAGKRCAADNTCSWQLDESSLNWGTNRNAPPEVAGDCGWQPGPDPQCVQPTFTGPAPGAVDVQLRTADASPMLHMRALLPIATLQKVARYTADNVERHLAAKGEEELPLHRSRDTCMAPGDITWEVIEIWLAVRCRTGMLNEHVPVSEMWCVDSWAYQPDIADIMPEHKYQFLNRFISFADPNDPAQEVERGEVGFDRQRKRRELSDEVTKRWPMVYHPHQHLSVDDVIEPNKHQQCVRVKFKASVHSGNMGDGVADCHSHYMLGYKQRYWDSPELANRERKRGAAEHASSTTVLQLLQLYQHKGHVCFLDRGYGHVQMQRTLQRRGIASTSMMQVNRKGLPRGLLHLLDSMMDEKWQWCVLHRDGFELQIWRDSKLCMCLTSCHTGPQVGYLGRGTAGESVVWRVWTPQGLYTYNTFGRSGVDGNDQLRDMLNMARRRCVRDGTKGILFLFDITITNGYIMWKEARDVVASSLKDSKYQFEKEWVLQVLQAHKGVRAFRPLVVLDRPTPLTELKTKSVVCTTSTQVLAVQAVQHNRHKLFLVREAVEAGEFEYGVHTQQSHQERYLECKGRCAVCYQARQEGGGSNTSLANIWCHHACLACSHGSRMKWFHRECFPLWPAHQDEAANEWADIHSSSSD